MSVPYHESLDLLIVGDSKVGKSTLINCYLTRRFSFVPSGVLKSKIEIPGTEYGCKSVNIHLCDSNKWNENLEKSILSSSAILIVGSWDNPQSINRIENYWIPSVSKLCESQSIPIIIIINKSDMLGGLDNVDYMNEDYRSSLCNQLQQYHIVKHVFQTSCIEVKSVTTAFDIAIQLIIYPIQNLIISTDDYAFKSFRRHTSYPYYKAISEVKRKLKSKTQQSTQVITEPFLLALRRIFHIMDRDNNALLTDNEILHYYCNCLALQSMKLPQFLRLKQWLLTVSNTEQKEIANNKQISICYVRHNAMTFAGFVQLHMILVQMLQHDTIWKSLQKFGYKRRNLAIDPKIYPMVPNKTEAAQYCAIHNAILRTQIKDLINKASKNRIQYELSPNIAGFLMSIFIDVCENNHDEYENKFVHEYCTCFVSRDGLKTLLQKYNIDRFPFDSADLELVGVTLTDDKHDVIPLTAWLSLWSLLMCYDTDNALRYLVCMGAPTIFPSHDFTPKWTDYLVPQITASCNTHQRFYNTLIVTYPYNETLVKQFIKSSVNDFTCATACDIAPHSSYVTPDPCAATPQRQNRHKSQKKKIPAASRTGSLSPIVEATKEDSKSPRHFALDANNYQEYMYSEEDHKYAQHDANIDGDEDKSEDKDSIQRLNTILLMKPRDKKSNSKYYSYGMLNDSAKAEYIYHQHHSFLFKNTPNRRKSLIELNLLNKDLGVDAYHILHESWPPNEHISYPITGQNQLFEMETKCNGNQNNIDRNKKVEKHIKGYDAVIYLHTTHALEYSANIVRLYDICRDTQLPIITVHIPFDVRQNDAKDVYLYEDSDDVNKMEEINLNEDSLSIITGQSKTAQIGTPKQREKQLKHEQSMKQLQQILEIYDLPQRLLRWESFEEDQVRFSHDLIERLHFRAMFIPKTIWQKRKINALRYTKKASMYALGIGVFCYLTPVNSLTQYLKLPLMKKNDNRQDNKVIESREEMIITKQKVKKQKKKKTEIENPRNDRWKTLIAIAVVTSVFYGGFYIYDIYGEYRNVKREQNLKKNEEEDEDEEDEKQQNKSMLSCLASFLYPKVYDIYDEDEEDYNDDDLSLTSFGFLRRKKTSFDDNDK